MTAESRPWQIWCYWLGVGWSPDTTTYASREEAREVRSLEHIDHDGWPPEFVTIRATWEQPPQAVIDRVRADFDAARADG